VHGRVPGEASGKEFQEPLNRNKEEAAVLRPSESGEGIAPQARTRGSGSPWKARLGSAATHFPQEMPAPGMGAFLEKRQEKKFKNR